MLLPSTIDLTPEGKIKKRTHIGEEGYYENAKYSLQINIEENNVFISYYGDDDNYLEDERILELIETEDFK